MPPKSILIAACAIAALASPVAAQDQGLSGGEAEFILAQADNDHARTLERERTEAASDEVRALVYSPEFILENRRLISLSDRQRDQMVADLQGLQTQLISQQMEMEDSREALITAMRAQPANERRVLTALDEVLNIEREVKRLQMRTLLRLRDALTPSQRARLNELRDGG
jgi:hypothetical protein